uniref:Uncharacterized protein n=1 Tax=Hahella chejuensis TaxID=158327 RepID=W6JRY7_9GAMM|nr:hypothetical protein [Hahella chejuensis]
MNHAELIEKLEKSGFEQLGTASAFGNAGEWVIGLIGLSGRFQQAGTKAFVICARPISFDYMERPKGKFHCDPMEYPFKLTLNSFGEKLKYQSQLLHFEHSRMDTEGDWSKVFDFLVSDLPESLSSLGVSGLVQQLKAIREPGYIEKIWLGELGAKATD